VGRAHSALNFRSDFRITFKRNLRLHFSDNARIDSMFIRWSLADKTQALTIDSVLRNTLKFNNTTLWG
jgi:hypothetical protein